MKCEDAQQHWLAALADGTDVSQASGSSHMGTCPDCRAFMAQNRALDAVLAQDANAAPRPGFDTRFFARLKEIEEAPRRARRRVWALVFAGAAAVALAGVLWLRQPQDALPPTELALAMDMDLLKEDVQMLADLQDVEDFITLEHLPPDALQEVRER